VVAEKGARSVRAGRQLVERSFTTARRVTAADRDPSTGEAPPQGVPVPERSLVPVVMIEGHRRGRRRMRAAGMTAVWRTPRAARTVARCARIERGLAASTSVFAPLAMRRYHAER
jgi:hypothetical protein